MGMAGSPDFAGPACVEESYALSFTRIDDTKYRRLLMPVDSLIKPTQRQLTFVLNIIGNHSATVASGDVASHT